MNMNVDAAQSRVELLNRKVRCLQSQKGSETFNSSPICSAAFIETGMNHNAGRAQTSHSVVLSGIQSDYVCGGLIREIWTIQKMFSTLCLHPGCFRNTLR